MSAASRATAQQKPSFANAIFFDSPSAFGTWLSQNHATATEVFVGYYKKHTGRQVMPWSQAVDEALCWGWIDGQVKSIDSNRTAQRFTPRKKKGSHWSRINVEKVAILEAAGRMRDPGRAAFALRTEENTAQTYFEREAKGLSEEFKVRLETDEGAAAYVEGRTPGYRRQVFDWIMSAKRPETRERRLVELIESSAQQLDVRQFRR
ncbi:uncharacterized protein BCR38DRAFT_334522 [Pseudomassariella vexata]|uniref:Bacteriocin-protection protein n=1 Tax=Pseudomassariella vexata TaxID=1141098 RepID=A0A1Y2E9X4_9PEZI|nr:uncharacterized protein BCR38DRAFT_334522 [Pseudomassariella vexata]ORY68388.1 hypothetical protein BCR38DRAFT_334522 [Pseudomassariella vexata]